MAAPNSYLSFHSRKEAFYAPKIRAAIREQVIGIASAADVPLMLDSTPLLQVFKDMYPDCGKIQAMQTYRDIMTQVNPGELEAESGSAKMRHETQPASLRSQTKARMPMGFNADFTQSILDYFQLDMFNTINGIDQTTRDYLLATFTRATQNSWSINEITDEIAKVYDRNRARTIARTEITKAANYGSEVGAKKSGLATVKEWIAARDNRTRRDHATVDGQKVDESQPFLVGGYEMMRPGDGGGKDGRRVVPAREVVNCRCTVGRTVKRDENGKIVRL